MSAVKYDTFNSYMNKDARERLLQDAHPLPEHVWELVLCSKVLKTRDVIAFSMTCSDYHLMLQRNQWPKLISRMPKDFNDWYNEIQAMRKLKKKILSLLEEAAQNNYKNNDISAVDREKWDIMIEENPRYGWYTIHILKEIVQQNAKIFTCVKVNFSTYGNQTLKLYAQRALRFVMQIQLSQVYKEYCELLPQQQMIEQAIFLHAQWCQPQIDFSYKDFLDEIEDITSQVKLAIQLTHPKHPLNNVGSLQFEIWRTNNITEDENRDELGYRGRIRDFRFNKFSLVNIVMKEKLGYMCIINILMASVARRLGLRCFFSRSLDLFFVTPDPLYKLRITYVIRQHNYGYFTMVPISRTQQIAYYLHYNIPKILYDCVKYIFSEEFHGGFDKLSRLKLDWLEALYLVKCLSSRKIRVLLRVYTGLQINHDIILYYLRKNMSVASSIDLECEVKFLRRKQSDFVLRQYKRNSYPHLKYAVGIVVRNIIKRYTGIIYSWLAWKPEIDRSPSVYNVIKLDGSREMVDEDELEITRAGEIDFRGDMAMYFSHQYSHFLVPNAELTYEYPEDIVVWQRLLGALMQEDIQKELDQTLTLEENGDQNTSS